MDLTDEIFIACDELLFVGNFFTKMMLSTAIVTLKSSRRVEFPSENGSRSSRVFTSYNEMITCLHQQDAARDSRVYSNRCR